MLVKRTLVPVGLALMVVAVGIAVILNATAGSRAAQLESERALQEVNRILIHLGTEIADFRRLNHAWAQSAVWTGVTASDENTPPPGLTAAQFRDLALTALLIVDADGEPVYSQGFDLAANQEAAVPPAVSAALLAQPSLLDPGPAGQGGVVFAGTTPMIVAAAPIPRISASVDSASSGAVLVWARYLDEAARRMFSAVLQLPIEFQPLDAAASAVDISARQSLSLVTPATWRELDADTLAAYGVAADLNGQPALVIRTTVPRLLSAQVQSGVVMAALGAVAAGLVAALLALVVTRRAFRLRAGTISAALQDVAYGNNPARRVDVPEDELLADMALSINVALDALAAANRLKTRHTVDLGRKANANPDERADQDTFLEAMLDSMGEGVIYGTDSNIEYANHTLATMTGYSEAELIGKQFSFLFGVPAPLETRRFLSASEGVGGRWVQRGEGRMRCNDGSTLAVAYSITPLDSNPDDGKKLYIIRDITEERALQARKDRFLAHASHELRTPMTNLLTRLYLLRRQPDQLEEHLDIVDAVAAHMKSLIDDLLDISRFKKGTLPLKRERNNLQAIIRHVVQIQQPEADRKSIALSVHLPSEPVDAHVDRKRFVQVLTNLVVNAINYTPAHGSVAVELAEEARGKLTYALIRVRDTGIGIDEENLAQIFQPFFRIAHHETPGTGLGLAIVQEIIQQHGGEITVQSRPGEGSVFTVRILTLPPQTADETPPVETATS